MANQWYSKLGFSTNPFSIKPAVLTNELIANNIEPFIEKIEMGAIQFVEAPFGRGKTSMLKAAIAAFGGRRKIAYSSCIAKEPLELEKLLRNATLTGKLFGMMPSEMILLVDEAQDISKEDAKQIMEYFSKGNIKSVAFFGTEYVQPAFPNEMKKSLNGNVMHLPAFTEEQAIEFIRKRVGNIRLLPDYVIREIHLRSGGNPRRLLQHCEDLCRKAAELSIAELSVNHVQKFLKSSITPVAKKKTEKTASKRKKAKSKPKTAAKGKIAETRKTQASVKKAEKASQTEFEAYDVNNIRTYEEEMGTQQDAYPEK